MFQSLRPLLLSRFISALFATVCAVGAGWGAELNISSMDLSGMSQGYGKPAVNKSVSGNPLRIGGKIFTNGIGSHAESILTIDLKKAAQRFTAQVGVDDETGGGGTVEFTIIGDGKTLWSSGIMKGKDPAKAIDVDLKGVKKLTLQLGNGGDGKENDHADWADAVITYQGKVPGPAVQSISHIFSDNMVLQRGQPIPVWGWIEPGESVEVTFGKQVKKAVADTKGNWMVRLDPMPANKVGQDLVIRGADSETFKNVLVGDVWVCSGQSNMEFGTGGSLNGQEEIKTANYPIIRYIQVERATAPFPERDFKGAWQVVSPGTVGGCTAVGYFFARELVKDLDVPIGLIHSNWSGTAIEPWICREGFDSVPELAKMSEKVDAIYPDTVSGQKKLQDYVTKMQEWLPLAEKAVAAKRLPPSSAELPAGLVTNSGSSTALYNGMIAPAVPFGIKGAIWYQGESNGGEGDTYYQKMKALVGGWRQVWKEGEFPFYWVQLANFQTSDPAKPEMGDGWAKLREAQLKSLEIPHTGMAVIIDIGDATNIHPQDKQDVGKRLAAWALAKDYGKKIEYSGPIYQKNIVKGNKIFIAFDHVGKGLMIGEKSGLEAAKEVVGGKLKWISIAGEDKKFYWADAVIEGNNLVVSSDKVPNPVAVRYAFTNNPTGPLLYNKDGFPASPFRTDIW
jgi:sialate O-acetylesterase